MSSVYDSDDGEPDSSSVASDSIENRDLPYTYFALALPPRIRPKTSAFFPRSMLQIQQLSADSRPSPILDIYQPSFFMSGTAQSLSTRLKLRKRDICIARSDYVEEMPTGRSQKCLGQNKEVVAVIRPYQKKNKTTPTSPTQGEVYFQEGQCWECTTVSDGNYQFTMKNKDGMTKTALWRRHRDKDSKNRGGSSVRNPTISAAVEKVAFLLADPADYTSPLAIMTRKGIEVFDQGPKTGPDIGLRKLNHDYSIILTFGTWVAFQGGWFK